MPWCPLCRRNQKVSEIETVQKEYDLYRQYIEAPDCQKEMALIDWDHYNTGNSID